MRRLLSGARGHAHVLVVILVAALLAFAALAVLAEAQASGTGLDARINDFLVAHRTAALDQFFLKYTGLGQWFVLAAAALFVTVGLTARGRRREALFLVVVMGLSLSLSPLLKVVFARTRPPAETALVHPSSYAFPSGHAMWSASLALALIVIAWPTRWRWPATVLAALFALLMSFSRLYLGAHWLTDVLAGWALAVAIVTATVILFRRVSPAGDPDRTPPDPAA